MGALLARVGGPLVLQTDVSLEVFWGLTLSAIGATTEFVASTLKVDVSLDTREGAENDLVSCRLYCLVVRRG